MLTHRELLDIQTLLPKAAFQPKPARVFWLFFYLSIGLTCYYYAGLQKSWQLTIALGGICGIAFTSITYLAHDLSHGTIIRNKTAVYCLENIFWSLFGITPTFWKRLHNQNHHAHFNTIQDTDRLFLEKERNSATTIVANLFFPSTFTIPGNPLIFLNYIFYIVLNTTKVFLRHDQQALMAMPGEVLYQPGDRYLILREFGSIIAIQLGLFALTNFSLLHFLLFSATNMCVISSIVILYGFTQHMLKPISANSDALHGATSVIVPKWIDTLHSHISYHVEHHLFPNMNPSYFPIVSKILEKQHSQTYQRISLFAAWTLLGSRDSAFVKEQEIRKLIV